ncbi:MAG TPA: hypothetical protein VGX23_28000 [Actinocrinis sp.]|nr:hypothetical protein [Actinocrinis sp.]
MAQHQLLHHQARLDGLAETDVIGDQQVRPRHLQSPHYRIELVVLRLDPGSERGLQQRLVRRRHRAPAHRVQERVQFRRLVETACRGGQGVLLAGRGTGLQLPQDTQLLVSGVVVHGNQGDQMLCFGQ